ncbi:hypothetical protein [Kutzneria kofuensis]|uniref:nSTAND1 domain-containing NTPase n=1 Tax=Kutzneria kofuensis TaxID=103725 RepID=UPI0031EF1436
MPRGERPLDPGDTPLLRFAADLRKLREKAGNPVYRELSRRAHYSAPSLSDAAGGRKLPTLAVTLAYVAACDGDTAAWEQRWREVAAELAYDATPETSGRPPYLGLSAFQIEDADRFFGRDDLVAELLEQVRNRRFVGVFGASGAGKSSLLRAGLVAAAEYRALVFTPGAHPLEEAAVQVGGLTGVSTVTLRAEFADDPTALHLRVRETLPDEDLLLVVDQFEELFTLCADEAERQAFVAALVHAATVETSRTRVVIGVRADFLGHCTQLLDLREALRGGQVLVGPMTADELRVAITKPAAGLGQGVEAALVTRLIADAVGQPGVLPLVSHALLETWRRRQGVTLTLAGYDAAGGIRHAIAQTAEAVYAGFDAARSRIAPASCSCGSPRSATARPTPVAGSAGPNSTPTRPWTRCSTP